MFLDFDPPYSNNDFFSIVIMTFVPPQVPERHNHVLRLLESIHQWADMPFEIILNDDASCMESRISLFRHHEMVSTMIFNTGINMGFSASANKVVSLANSNYVLLLNDDTLFTRPFLRDLKRMLDVPYIGACTAPVEGSHGGDDGVNVLRNNFTYHLGSNPASSGLFAFHKSRWLETNGFPQVYNNGGDISWLYTLLQRGYFNATWYDSNYDGPAVRNIDREEKYALSSGGRVEYDQSYPHIFGISPDQYQWECINRKNRRYPISHQAYLDEYGIHNIASWRNYFLNAVVPGENRFDWDKLSRFGQNKWKEEVEQDIQRFKEAKISGS